MINNATSSDGAAAAAAATAIVSTICDAPSRRKTDEILFIIFCEWRSPSPNKLVKRVIHRRRHTYNKNESLKQASWKPDTITKFSLTP